MSNTLATILRDQKAAIAQQLVATLPSDARQSEDARQAFALAQVDSLIGMAQQPEDIRQQTLQELTRSQLAEVDDFAPALEAIQREHDAAVSAVSTAFPEASQALEAMIELDRLTMQRSQALLTRMHEHVNAQIAENAVEKQMLRSAVQELSTPIVPLYSGILVLPLVGSIDGGRAQDVTEQLLEAIAREQADIVLLDVTGLSALDTNIANHLLQTARAASLLGSQVILVGISAEIAQTLVHLDVDLGTLVTLSDLQSGVEFALEQLGLAIRPVE